MDGPEHAARTEVVRGEGALARVPGIVAGRVFLVTDPGVVAAGHADRVAGHRVGLA